MPRGAGQRTHTDIILWTYCAHTCALTRRVSLLLALSSTVNPPPDAIRQSRRSSASEDAGGGLGSFVLDSDRVPTRDLSCDSALSFASDNLLSSISPRVQCQFSQCWCVALAVLGIALAILGIALDWMNSSSGRWFSSPTWMNSSSGR